MKKRNLVITGLAGMVALSGAAVFASSSITSSTSLGTTAPTSTTTTHPKKAMGLKGFAGQFNGGLRGMHGHGKGFEVSPELKAALLANDYNAFVTASKGTPMEGKVTQEQFANKSTRVLKQKAKKAAITANDYNAFVKANTPTQEEFNNIVAGEKSRAAIKAAITAN